MHAAEGFHKSLWSWAAIICVAVPLFATTEYVESRLTLEWRNWLCRELMIGYYSDRAFYTVGQKGIGQTSVTVDNPDQVWCWLSGHLYLYTVRAI